VGEIFFLFALQTQLVDRNLGPEEEYPFHHGIDFKKKKVPFDS